MEAVFFTTQFVGSFELSICLDVFFSTYFSISKTKDPNMWVVSTLKNPMPCKARKKKKNEVRTISSTAQVPVDPKPKTNVRSMYLQFFSTFWGLPTRNGLILGVIFIDTNIEMPPFQPFGNIGPLTYRYPKWPNIYITSWPDSVGNEEMNPSPIYQLVKATRDPHSLRVGPASDSLDSLTRWLGGFHDLSPYWDVWGVSLP